MINDVWKTVVGMGLAIVIVVAVALPIITQSFENISTAEANTDERYLTMTSGAPLTFSSDANGFTINGETHSWLTSSTGTAPDRYTTPLVFAKNFMIGPPVNTGNNTYSDPHLITPSGNVGAVSSFTIQDGTLTYGDSQTLTVDGPVYYVSDSGTYGMYKQSAHIDYGRTGYVVLYYWQSEGTRTAGIWSVTDGELTEVFDTVTWGTSTPATTATDASVASTAERDGPSYAFTVTGATVDGTAHAAGHLTVICPVEYHVVTETDSTLRTIASMIPILLVLSLVVGVAYHLAVRR